MSVAASVIIARVRNQLIDTGAYAPQRWTDAELLNWLSDGQRTIVAAFPRASQKRATPPFAAGSRQSIPTDGFIYLTAYRNMGPDRATPGNVLIATPRNLLDGQYPLWHAATQVASPVAVVFDPSDPKIYYVYPPSDGTGSVDLSYSAAVGEMSAPTDLLVVNDIYATPLFDYVMYRATQKDSDYVAGQAVAAAYLTAFEGFMKSLMQDPLTQATETGKT